MITRRLTYTTYFFVILIIIFSLLISCSFKRQVRHLGLAAPGQGGVTAFIHNALTPPGEAALGNALTLLTRIGAFRANESLTPLVRERGRESGKVFLCSRVVLTCCSVDA